jgi:cysteine-rich repeat protein
MRFSSGLLLAATAALVAACDPPAPEICGDGVRVGGEVCDDGNLADGDGCDAACSAATCLVPVTYPTIAEGLADAACPTLYLSPGTYTELVTISRDVTIVGGGAESAILDGDSAGTVVTVGAAATVTLRGITISGGQAAAGGGIVNDGTLTLDEVTVSDSVAVAELPRGGGIFNRGMLALTASVVTRNHLSLPADHDAHLAELPGAGIYSDGGMVRLDRGSRVEANEIATTGEGEIRGSGCGIFAKDASVVITGGSAIRDNTIDIESRREGASAGGAGLSLIGGSLTLDGGSAIEGNVATTSGGASEGISAAFGVGFAASDASVHLDAAFVRNNRAVARGAHHSNALGGGGYVASGSLLVSGTEITGNTARAEGIGNGTAIAEGGGLYLYTGARISDSRLSSNIVTTETESATASCFAAAGAIEAMPYMNESIVLERSTLDGNMVQSSGGYAEAGAIGANPFFLSGPAATVEVVQTTLSNNLVSGFLSAQGGAASARGGIDNGMVTLRFVNSTISGNRVDSPAGTASAGAVMGVTLSGATKINVHLASTTITGNSATGMIARSGGLFMQQRSTAEPVTCTLQNSIVAGNTAATDADCESTGAAITSGGYNLLGALGGCALGGDPTGNVTGEARLGPLGDNGGPTRTHALMAGSPAIDAGNPAGCSDVAGAVLAVDQRGQPRAAGGRCDIGAFEK